MKFLLFVLLLGSYGELHGQDRASHEIVELSLKDQGPFFNVLPPDVYRNYSIGDTAFLDIEITNFKNTEPSYGLFLSDAEYQELVIDGILYYTGKYQNTERLFEKWDNRHFLVPYLDLIKGPVQLKCYNISKKGFSIAPVLFSASKLEKGMIHTIVEMKRGIIFTIFFLGAIFIFLSYTLGLSIQTKNEDVKYYSLYLAIILLHNLIQADAFLKVFFLFPKNPIWYHILNEFVQMFIYTFFMLFVKVFLELKKNNPKMNTFVNMSILASVFMALLFLGISTITKDFLFVQNYLSVFWLIIGVLGSIVVIVVYRKTQSPIRYYLMFASVFLLIGSLMELFYSLNLEGGYNWNIFAVAKSGIFPFNFTHIAILGEIVCFALGIGYKIRKNEKLLYGLQQKEIDNLKLNEEKTELENSVLEKELMALRSQMNPHFLFNSLNSINSFIMREKPKVASAYLTKFSLLMRVILNNSKKKLLNLDEEIKAISLYLEMEKIRFGEKLNFDLEIDETLNVNSVLIPSMMIQPYVENAIKHGILKKTSGGKVWIKIYEKGGRLYIEIEDNGIGRERAADIKNMKPQLTKSYGMSITADRFDLLNRIYNMEGEIIIIDKKIDGQATGTLVKLSMKML